MKILNYGSLNIDHVYRVEHFVKPGETISSVRYDRFSGGKGLNQSIALAHSGLEVYHAGRIGGDGEFLVEKLQECGVDTRFVSFSGSVTGHAIIQVNDEGENCIILHGGANREITESDVRNTMGFFNSGDYVILQNEINNIATIMELATERGLSVVFNPAPMGKAVFEYPLEYVDIFIVNEIEGRGLTGEDEPAGILQRMGEKYPGSTVVLTRGARGASCMHKNRRYDMPAAKVDVVDTTAAGDTFIGYFTSCFSSGISIEKCLETACRASAICISRPGAADSIPARDEVGGWPK